MNVKIPNPCNEKYEGMSPTELGRMCKVCNTEVVDFTNWETKDIVGYIQKSNQKVCGKLYLRSIPIKETKTKNWISFAASLITLFSSNSIVYSMSNNNISKPDIHSSYLQDSLITFQFLDKYNQHLPYVNLTNTKTNKKYIADNTGKITIPYEEKAKFKITYLGFKTRFIIIKKSFKKNDLTRVTLDESEELIGEVVVTPIQKLKPSFNKEISSNRKIEPLNTNTSPNSNRSLIPKLKKLFNIFSIKDED